MALQGNDRAYMTARFGAAKFGATRFGFTPKDTKGAFYPWRIAKKLTNVVTSAWTAKRR